MSKLMFSVLPFRVWNHMFLCERSQYCIDMYIYCTKFCVSNKKISDHINKNLYVPIQQSCLLEKELGVIQKVRNG